MITRSDGDAYRDRGYLVVPDVLDGAMVRDLRADRPDDPRVRRVKVPHRFAPWDRLARVPRLVSVLTALLGPAVRLHGSKINLKSPRYGSPVEWHQDWAFYPHTNDDLLAVGVMLDDCTSDNGPLLVCPGTHRGPVFDHHADGYFCGAVDPADAAGEIAHAVPLTGRAGSMSFHHVRLLHGSAQNVSSLPRALLLYEYAAADAWPLLGVKDLADFDARLVSGEPTIEPRLTPVPVRMPLPPARHQGSIYENQADAARRYFEVTAEG